MHEIMILTFVLVYIFLCNWFQIIRFLKALISPKQKISQISDSWISDTIKKKTGLVIKKIIIFENDKLFGMMAGIPTKPIMILSRGIYREFTKGELEWVILHEAAHCRLWHSMKMAVTQITLLIIGIILNSYFNYSIFSLIFFTILMALIFIQYAKTLEYEADKYSIDRVAEPKAVIWAQEKMIKHYKINEKSFFRKYFTSGTLPSQRIALAKARISNNKFI